jgi:hypothetical protein
MFTTHTVTVYINDSRDASFGFDNEFSGPVLHKAIEFDLQAWHKDGADTLLAVIYKQLNIVDPRSDEAYGWTAVYRMRQFRSLSVGDVVVLDGQAYAVARAGFDEITDEAVKAGIRAYLAAEAQAVSDLLEHHGA